jgi:hypothetical protein
MLAIRAVKTTLISKAATKGKSFSLNKEILFKLGCCENKVLAAHQASLKLSNLHLVRPRQHSTTTLLKSINRQGSNINILRQSNLILASSHRSYSNQGSKSESATYSVLKKGCIFFLVATGAAVWTLQLVELLAAWIAPDEYASFMGFDTEEEEERRTQRFYAVPPHLGDDAYYVELAARHAALKELLFRMEASPSILGMLGSSRTTDTSDGAANATPPTPSSGLEMVFLTDTTRLAPPDMDGAEPREVWRPRMYLEGPARAVLATATFERAAPPPAPRRRGRDGGDPTRGWVPVALSMEAVGEAPAGDRLLLDSRAPLPHGIRYSTLRARDGDYDT